MMPNQMLRTPAPMVAGTSPNPSTPRFDPVAYEAQGSQGQEVPYCTVWDNPDIFQYIRSATPSPTGTPPGPTPSPPGVPQTAARGIRVEPGFVRPVPIAGYMSIGDFLAQLPDFLIPNSVTPTYTTPNGMVSYYAYAEQDGVTKVCMVGAGARLKDAFIAMAERGLFNM